MNFRRLLRYGVWGLVAVVADANRREYRMATTWLPHLTINTVTLFFPDLLRAVLPRQPRDVIRQALVMMARDNPNYVVYVIPLAAGYITSHPRYNIYKGAWGEIRLGGLVGLDAIPHGATAGALTLLVCDTLKTASELESSGGWLDHALEWAEQHQALASFGVLAAATLVWEVSEYYTHKYELAQRGDPALINMQWSVRDTVQDVAVNFTGWLLAILWRTLSRQ